jgi:heavy metal translocating P-type ATPase
VVAAVLAGAQGRGADAERSLLLRIGLAAFFSCGTMVLTLFLYSGDGAPPAVMRLIHLLLAACSAPVFVLLAPPFLAGLARDARRARFSMDSLIALGSGAAFVLSCASVVRGRGEIYFDTATMVLLLVTVGRLIEAHAHVSSRRALAELISLQPPSARVLRGTGWTMVDAAALQPGDRVHVLAGERIPADGRIARGAVAVDESMLTGESLPAERGEGDVVRAGTLSLNGALEIDVDTAPGETLLARIVRTVEEAQRARSPLETLADRLSAALVPLTVLLAAATAAWWWRSGPERALLNGLSVLVVACPCSLGIALPMVNVRALAAAARSGILVRSAGALHELARVDTVVFDKTGTVTAGCVRVRGVTAVHGTERELLAAAASAAAGSRHPASQAVREAAARAGIGTAPARRCEEIPGRGVVAELEDGRRILLGRPQWVAQQTAGGLETDGSALVCAAGSTVLGGFSLHDPVTAGARETAVQLRAAGLRLALLSGDAAGAVADAARVLGIDHAEGALLPEDKAARVGAMRAAGRRVAMVGDGINDAPALASATVGIAVSGGTDVARETAQIVLLRPGLLRVVEAWRLARAARRMGRQNLAWAAGYNSLALAAAASGGLKPQWAAALMLASSVCVILNILRLPKPPA